MYPEGAISTARRRRRELHEAMCAMEVTLARPAAVGAWRKDLRRDAEWLRDALAQHASDTEASGGIFDAMSDEAPRLEPRIAALRAEHPGLLQAAVALVASADRLGGESGGDVEVVRQEALELLGALSRHRQQGADLVYDAFDLDIGGSG